MKNSILIFATIALAVLSSCNQTKLSNDDAKLLIVKTLNLPITYRHDIDKRPSMGSGFELDGLRSAGLITGSEYLDSRTAIKIQITEIGQSSFIGENNDAYMFNTNDIDFDQITGISINKEEQTATVRFSLKAKNATLAAYALAKTKAGFSGKNYINYSLINPLNGELVFKKFDKGWQLLEQGKASSDLLNQILDSDANSNNHDDYSKLIQDKWDVIYGNDESQTHFTDVQEFYNAFKKALLAKNMNEVAKFLHYPFICDYGTISKKELLSGNYNIGVNYFDIIIHNDSLENESDSSYRMQGQNSCHIVKHEDGYWKLDGLNVNNNNSNRLENLSFF